MDPMTSQEKNVMKNEFGWEIPYESVPLPSKGIIYNPDTTLFNTSVLKIKAMTAKEEDIISSQAFIKEGTVVENLIKSCLVDKSFNVDDLINGDRNALMVSIRITGYGSDYNMTHNCNHCGHNNKVVAQLSELEIRRLKNEPLESGKNLFKFVLPVTKKTIHYKFMTGKDEKEENIKQKRKEALGFKSENKITSFLENVIVSIDGVTDKNKITHFIRNMPAKDSRMLRLHINENEPGIDMKWEYQCSNCQGNNKIGIPITSEFFWPTT